jgi:Ribosomal L25p family
MATSSLRAFLRSTASSTARISKRKISGLERFEDPSKYVVGVTKEQLYADENLQAFFLANFPEEPVVERPKKVQNEEELVSPAIIAEEVRLNMLQEARSALNIRPLHGYKRNPDTEEGTRRCYPMRDIHGFIPGLIYGGDPAQGIVLTSEKSSKIFVKTKWGVIHRELTLYYNAFEGRVYDLTVYEDDEDTVGIIHRVIPRDMQRHPVYNKIYCLNYLRYHPKRPIKLALKYVNEEESNALKRGGFIVPRARYIECLVEDGVPIPDTIHVECTGLKLKQVVRLDRLIFPDGVKPVKKVDPKTFLVGSVFGRRSAIGND